MDIQLIQNLIASLGFPIFVATYFMVKSTHDMQKMTEAINKLEQTLTLLKEKIQ